MKRAWLVEGKQLVGYHCTVPASFVVVLAELSNRILSRSLPISD